MMLAGSVAPTCTAMRQAAPVSHKPALLARCTLHKCSLAGSSRQQARRQLEQVVAHAKQMFEEDVEEEEEYIREYPNKRYIEETLAEFPDAGVASVEQARVLFSAGGYTYLDVRPKIEYEDVGRVVGSVNIPIVNSVRKYDPEQKKKVTTKTPNDNFVADVEKRFKDKSTKLLIGCSNGKAYSMDALIALDEAGYENIVGLRGGFYAWFSVFDNKLGRRKTGEYAETYTHDGDSCGIHSSGAGFDRVDKADKWVPAEY